MPKDDPVTDAPPASPRWMRILLVVSLALNLLIAGAVVGMVLRGGPSPVGVRDVGIGPFAAALSPEDRAALRRDFIARTTESGTSRRDRREAMRALLAALRAEPFDPGALRAVLSRVSDRMSGRLDLGLSLIEGRIATMADADRQAFADRLERELRRGRRGAASGGDVP